MSNLIDIDFALCDPAPANGYRVRYRPQGVGGPYLTWPTRFFATPAVFDDAGAQPDGTLYEGLLDADCGVLGFGNAVVWATPADASSSAPPESSTVPPESSSVPPEESSSVPPPESSSPPPPESSSPPPPPCVPVEFVEGSVPDGVEGVPYAVDLTLTGDAPFTLGSVTKPSWMTVTLDGDVIHLTGTPDAPGTGEELTIEVGNCDATADDTFSDTLDVASSDGLGTISMENCDGGVSITDAKWNGLEPLAVSGDFPVNNGGSITVSHGTTGASHTLVVSISGDSGIGVVFATDSTGALFCQNFNGSGSYSFPGFIIGLVNWSVDVNCAGSC